MSKPATSKCRGCGITIVQNPNPSYPLKQWHSELCRKNTLYGSTCVRCGGKGYSSTRDDRSVPFICMKCKSRLPKPVLPVSLGRKRGHWGQGIPLAW